MAPTGPAATGRRPLPPLRLQEEEGRSGHRHLQEHHGLGQPGLQNGVGGGRGPRIKF